MIAKKRRRRTLCTESKIRFFVQRIENDLDTTVATEPLKERMNNGAKAQQPPAASKAARWCRPRSSAACLLRALAAVALQAKAAGSTFPPFLCRLIVEVYVVVVVNHDCRRLLYHTSTPAFSTIHSATSSKANPLIFFSIHQAIRSMYIQCSI